MIDLQSIFLSFDIDSRLIFLPPNFSSRIVGYGLHILDAPSAAPTPAPASALPSASPSASPPPPPPFTTSPSRLPTIAPIATARPNVIGSPEVDACDPHRHEDIMGALRWAYLLLLGGAGGSPLH